MAMTSSRRSSETELLTASPLPLGSRSVKQGIADRLAALQFNGENGWKRNTPALPGRMSTPLAGLQRTPSRCDSNSIGDRLSALKQSQTAWQARSDGKTSEAQPESKAVVDTSAWPEIPRERIMGRKREMIDRMDRQPSEESEISEPSPDWISQSDVNATTTDDFFCFAEKPSSQCDNGQMAEVTESDLDAVCGEQYDDLGLPARRLLAGPRKPRLNARKRSSTAASAPTSAKPKQKPSFVMKDPANPSAHLAAEARAGLASTEDFSAVKLRKSSQITESDIGADGIGLRPFKDPSVPMLIQFKGRKQCQARLIRPHWTSVIEDDAYVLICPPTEDGTTRRVINYVGSRANVIERTRSAELAAQILKTKDLGCKQSICRGDLIESGQPSAASTLFWSTLDKSDESTRQSSNVDDELFEAVYNKQTAVYAVSLDSDGFDCLVPVESAWGRMPRHSSLLASNQDKVLIFDFGSEIYMWCGRQASSADRHAGSYLVKQIHSTLPRPHHISLVHQSSSDEDDSDLDWTLVGRVAHRTETALFKSKFADWPSEVASNGRSLRGPVAGLKMRDVKPDSDVRSRHAISLHPNMLRNANIIGVKDEHRRQMEVLSGATSNLPAEMEIFDAALMVQPMIPDGTSSAAIGSVHPHEPNLRLENASLGRGFGFYDAEERRQYEVVTLDVQVWHCKADEASVEQLHAPSDSGDTSDQWPGHFLSTDSYIVKWSYKVSLTGRSLKGQPSRHAAVGRDRTAYFVWQGARGCTSERGLSALATIRLDKEEAPQMIIDQGQEPAAFLSLWRGAMVVHLDRKRDMAVPRYYVVRATVDDEVHLIEVEAEDADLPVLRSLTSFVVLNNDKVSVWHGQYSPEHCRKHAESAAKNLCHNLALPTVRSHVGLGRDDSKMSTFRLSEAKVQPDRIPTENSVILPTKRPRLFNFTTVLSGGLSFKVVEVTSPAFEAEKVDLMPFLQSNLYIDEQPAHFLLDTGREIWLWHGWFNQGSTTSEDRPASPGGGTALIRFHAERRAAMETAVKYCQLVYGETHPDMVGMKLAWAGHEPESFFNLFPFWQMHDEARLATIELAKSSTTVAVDRCDPEPVVRSDLRETLHLLSKSVYSWPELMVRPLPDGVDPTRLETYLTDADFQAHLEVSREDFNKAPRWRQIEIRKKHGLF